MTHFMTKACGGRALRNTRIFSLLLSATFCLCTQLWAQTQTANPFSAKPVTIEGHGRALEAVLSQVQMAFRFPIYYEELPLENHSDLKVVAILGIKQGLVSPVSDLSVTLTDTDSTPYLAAKSVVAAYSKAGYPGMYKVVPHAHRIEVVPAQVRSSSGSMKDIVPMLSVPITFPLAERTVGDTLQLILDAASKQSGYPVLVIRAPAPTFQKVELSANGEALGDVLEDLSAALGSVFSVALRYVPDEKSYYFDVAPIAPPDAAGKPAVHGKSINPTYGPANSPFFIKTK
ncbi:MAG: hypothetical protein ACRD6B_02615 [Bryobacteraceae bacterium]